MKAAGVLVDNDESSLRLQNPSQFPDGRAGVGEMLQRFHTKNRVGGPRKERQLGQRALAELSRRDVPPRIAEEYLRQIDAVKVSLRRDQGFQETTSGAAGIEDSLARLDGECVTNCPQLMVFLRKIRREPAAICNLGKLRRDAGFQLAHVRVAR